MNQQPKERLNMPAANEIINMKINRPFKKPAIKSDQIQIPANILTCKTCNKDYDQNKANNLIEKLSALPDFDYQTTCLNCLRQQSSTIKLEKYSHLSKLKKDLDKLTISYQSLAKEYKALDYQEFIIIHEQGQAALAIAKARLATAKASVKKPSTKKPSDKSLIMKILANLTPEQQATVLANIKAQTIGKPNEL